MLQSELVFVNRGSQVPNLEPESGFFGLSDLANGAYCSRTLKHGFETVQHADAVGRGVHAAGPSGKGVGMYCCGPTVYDVAHIGNFRTFVFADLVRRYLEFKGFAVRHVMNITDVEDKIITRVREANIPLREFTTKLETAFFDDLKALGCLMPHETPRATEFIRKSSR